MKEIKRIAVMHTHFIFKRIQITSTLCNILRNPSYCYCSAIYFYQSFSLFFLSILYRFYIPTYKHIHIYAHVRQTHTSASAHIYIYIYMSSLRSVTNRFSYKSVQNNYFIFICTYAYGTYMMIV